MGWLEVLGGGKFGHGFASASVAQAAGGQIGRIGSGSKALDVTFARITTASVLGGTASKLTGGKFANGAITGAFSRAVNDEAHLSIQLKAPKILNFFQWITGSEFSIDGGAFGISWSAPNSKGEGEYDIGIFGSADLKSVGLSTGRVAVGYGESWDSGASVRDVAGYDGAVTGEFARGGGSLTTSGWDIFVGPGAGGSYTVQGTNVFSFRHMKWYEANQE